MEVEPTGQHNRISWYMDTGSEGKGKGKWSIAVRNTPHRYGNSHAILDHTVLPAIRQRWHCRPYRSRSWYSIKRPRGMSMLTQLSDRNRVAVISFHRDQGDTLLQDAHLPPRDRATLCIFLTRSALQTVYTGWQNKHNGKTICRTKERRI